MRCISFLLIVFYCLHSNCQAHYFFPDMDIAAIDLIHQSELRNPVRSEHEMNNLIDSWEASKAKVPLSEKNIHETAELYLANIKFYQSTHQYLYVKYLTLDFMLLFKERRQCNHLTKYPIDRLLDLIFSQYLVSYVSNDQMLSKLSWFEFMDVVDELKERYVNYTSVRAESIQYYFPDVDVQLVKETNSELDVCLQDLFAAINTDQRKEFEVPCSNVEKKLSKLLYLFGKTDNL